MNDYRATRPQTSYPEKPKPTEPKPQEPKEVTKPSYLKDYGESAYLSDYTIILKITATVDGVRRVFPYSIQTNKDYLSMHDLEQIKQYFQYNNTLSSHGSDIKIIDIVIYQRINNLTGERERPQ